MHYVEALMTMAISVDRLLTLLLGLRYKQTVILKCTYIIAATIWVLFSIAALCYSIHTYTPYGAFQSQCYITKFQEKVIPDDLTSSKEEKKHLLFFDIKGHILMECK